MKVAVAEVLQPLPLQPRSLASQRSQGLEGRLTLDWWGIGLLWDWGVVLHEHNLARLAHQDVSSELD